MTFLLKCSQILLDNKLEPKCVKKFGNLTIILFYGTNLHMFKFGHVITGNVVWIGQYRMTLLIEVGLPVKFNGEAIVMCFMLNMIN